MSECDKCGEYSDCLHPVGFMSKFFAYRHKIKVDEEIHDALLALEKSLAYDRWDGETDPLTGEPDYFSSWSVYLCHKCMKEYRGYIQTWG